MSRLYSPTGSIAIRSASFPDVYDDLLDNLIDSPFEEVNARTGAKIKMLDGGASFKLDLYDQRLPVTGTRKLYPHVAAAETAWFLMGLRTTEFLNKHGVKIWDKFTEADTFVVEAAYGYRWRRFFGRDQLLDAVKTLREDPTSRRVWVQAWDPIGDGLTTKGQKNVPCPVGFTFSIIGGMLHSSLFIRSSDVFVGLPYDVMGHAMLMGVVAASIGCAGLGTMQVTLAHPHLYEVHWDMASACLSQASRHEDGPSIYAWDLDMVEKDPDGFVWAYRKAASEVSWPTYAPKPELIV